LDRLSVANSIEEAAETAEGNPWYRAVYLEGEPVGFVMLKGEGLR
jgi:diamine N-acetyltransferase